MHEFGLMEVILEKVQENADREGAQHVHHITLRVGHLSGVVPEALTFAFDILKEGTIAANSDLLIQEVPTYCYCSGCQHMFYPDQWIYRCPSCHRISSDIRQGKELELESMEVS